MVIGICDDEKYIRSHIRSMIEQQESGCRIVEFSSGKELLAWLEDTKGHSMDLLFLDISMEDMDGMTAARRLRLQTDRRQEPVWGSLPLLIFVTGYAEYMPEAFGVHAFQYMVKPVKEQEFQRIFGQAVKECCRLKAGAPESPRELLLKKEVP